MQITTDRVKTTQAARCFYVLPNGNQCGLTGNIVVLNAMALLPSLCAIHAVQVLQVQQTAQQMLDEITAIQRRTDIDAEASK